MDDDNFGRERRDEARNCNLELFVKNFDFLFKICYEMTMFIVVPAFEICLKVMT